MGTGQRDLSFDFLKCMAIFLVVLGHCFQYMQVDGQSTIIYKVIYFFHMPLFMFISGFFYYPSLLKYNTKEIILNKLKTILLPVLVCQTLLHALSLKIPADIESFMATLWFLKTLFLFMIVAIMMKYNFLLGAVVSFFIMRFCPFITNNDYYTFFLAGVIYSKYYVMIKQYLIIILVVGIILLGGYIFCNLAGIDMLTRLFEQGPALTLMRLVTVGCIVALLNVVFRSGKSIYNKGVLFLCEYGKYTKEIYIIQTFVIEWMLKRYYPFKDYQNSLLMLCIALCLMPLFIYLSQKGREIPIVKNYFLGYWK